MDIDPCKSVLVVGGAGYIGSHMVKALLEAGHRVTTFENLSAGNRTGVLGGRFVEGDLATPDALAQLYSSQPFDAAMLIADSQQARSLLGWRPEHPELERIVAHAWQWAKNHAAAQAQPQAPLSTLAALAA